MRLVIMEIEMVIPLVIVDVQMVILLVIADVQTVMQWVILGIFNGVECLRSFNTQGRSLRLVIYPQSSPESVESP